MYGKSILGLENSKVVYNTIVLFPLLLDLHIKREQKKNRQENWVVPLLGGLFLSFELSWRFL